MAKTLFIGDIHNKTWIIDKIEKIINDDIENNHLNLERVVFVGDYIDDWKSTYEDNINTLERIFKLKDDYSDKIELLIGNHELSYLGYPCSGHKYPDLEISQLLVNNIDKLDLIYIQDKYLVSHAGFNKQFFDIMKDFTITNSDTILEARLNELLHKFDRRLYDLLAYSVDRIGVDSCLWQRPNTYGDDLFLPDKFLPEGYIQIAGHTPIKQSIFDSKIVINENTGIFYIDSFSTYLDGSPVGKQDILVLTENEPKDISLEALYYL